MALEFLSPVLSILDKIIPDPKAAAEAKLKALELAQNGDLAELDAATKLALGQIDVNKIEAADPSLFKSGWRPFVGWTCGVGLCTQLLIGPTATWIATLAGHPVPFPALDMGTLLTVLGGLLGLSYHRTQERLAGAVK